MALAVAWGVAAARTGPDRVGPCSVAVAVAELATVGLVEGLHLALVGVGRAGGAPPIREGSPPAARRGAPRHRAG